MQKTSLTSNLTDRLIQYQASSSLRVATAGPVLASQLVGQKRTSQVLKPPTPTSAEHETC